MLAMLLTILTAAPLSPGAVTPLAPDLEARPLGAGVWLHMSYADDQRHLETNGLLVDTPAGSVLVDTGWSKAQGARLLDWAASQLRRPVVAVIVTHFHRDRTGGAGAALERGIPVYALEATRAAARLAKLPVPDHTLTAPWTSLEWGGERLEVFFPGAGHTRDNAVVYLPRYGILYGGCFLKSAGAADLGNLGDADVPAWTASLDRLKGRYPSPVLVVPGHGPLGGDPVARTRSLVQERLRAGAEHRGPTSAAQE